MSEQNTVDHGAGGAAALSRPWCLVPVAGEKSGIRGSTIHVRRVSSNLFDRLLLSGDLTRKQHRAAVWALAKHRAGAFLPRVVARYGPRLSCDHDQLIDDDDSDPATEWRCVAGAMPLQPSRVLESVLLGAGLVPRELPLLQEALDWIDKWEL